ncbi:MAG TPA: hypothetical protein VIG87_07175, partial [Candidatus Udaeobacter sp.]
MYFVFLTNFGPRFGPKFEQDPLASGLAFVSEILLPEFLISLSHAVHREADGFQFCGEQVC